MAYKRILKTKNGILTSYRKIIITESGTAVSHKTAMTVKGIQKWQPSRPNTTSSSGLTVTVDKKTGIITVSGITNAKNTMSLSNQIYVKGHKYFARSGLKGFGTINNRNEPHFLLNYAYSGQEYDKPIIFTSLHDGTVYNLFYFSEGVEFSTPMIIRPELYDLTEIFGAGNEPSTVEEVEAILGKDYIPYQHI